MKNINWGIFHKYYKKDWGGIYPSEELVRFCNYIYKNKKKIYSILDVGCGKGASSWLFAKNRARLVLIDGSIDALNKIPKTYSYFGLESNYKIIHGDISFPEKYLSSKFDIIIDHYSLYSLESKKNFKKNFIKYFFFMKKSSKMFFSCFGAKSSKKYLLKKYGNQLFFMKSELNNFFKKNQIKIIHYENILEKKNNIKLEKHIYYLQKK